MVEVSDTTLAYDSGDKLRAYERGGIKEYWIVDLVRKAVHIHRLKEGRYQVTTQRLGKISPEHFSRRYCSISTNCFSGSKKSELCLCLGCLSPPRLSRLLSFIEAYSSTPAPNKTGSSFLPVSSSGCLLR